jgi:hypothetical protein
LRLANGGSAIGAILGLAKTVDILNTARRLHWRRINPPPPFGEGGCEDLDRIIELD